MKINMFINTILYRAGIQIIIVIMMAVTAYNANAQGCSDAGFCTMNSLKPNNNDNISGNANQIKIGASYGIADNSISAFGQYIEYNRQITDDFVIDAKFTALSQSGNDISRFGISDLYLNANYRVNNNSVLVLGTKIPLSDGNTMKDNLALPLDYQSSLGTFDIILGMSYEVHQIQFVIAYQQPLSHNNNEFLAENYPENSKLNSFQSTNKFKRSGDVLFRVSYPIMLGEKFKITPSILPIYHLSNDKFTNAFGVEEEIKGSQGLTLNANAYFDYEINSKNALQLNAGIPFIVRDARPDGLTRSFIANLEYRMKF